MKIKSYFASSVEQAIQQARQELGTEAMLVTSRRAAAESRHLGAYEVVFGAPDSEEIPNPRPHSKDLSAELQPHPLADGLPPAHDRIETEGSRVAKIRFRA